MHPRFRSLSLQIQSSSTFHSLLRTISSTFISPKILEFPLPIQRYHQIIPSNFTNPDPLENTSTAHQALEIQTLLKAHSNRPIQEISQRLDGYNVSLSEDLILNVLKRHRSDWKPAYAFFSWVLDNERSTGFSPGTSIYNEIIDILGRRNRFDELHQVLDEMSRRKNLINERTFVIVTGRYIVTHKIDEAVNFFNSMEDLGLRRDVAAFQKLLLLLCRYKHVEQAELLFHNMKSEFNDDIKTWNIVLKGWCKLRSLPNAKRFWNDITTSKCKPDEYTYAILINSFSKSGKATTSTELLRIMWDEGFKPDVVICNTVINGLCFKKRIPEALEIIGEMKKRGCSPNVATYNTLIKHLCKIRRMDKVCKFLSEMEEKGEACLPNSWTYSYLLKAAKSPREVNEILTRMLKSEYELGKDTYNLMLRLFVKWGDDKRAKCIWDEMVRSGLGPDKWSYTIIVHGLYDCGMIRAAMNYFDEMVSKGMVPEPRTELLVNDMKLKLNETERVRE